LTKYSLLVMCVLAFHHVYAFDKSPSPFTAPKLFISESETKVTKILDSSETNPKDIPVCYNFGCAVKKHISLTTAEWTAVALIFQPQTESAEIERMRVGKAIAKLEQLAGTYTPIHRDIGYNLGEGATFPGQLDCIDESINTTTFLHLLEDHNLLKHHKVVDRAYRQAIFNQHWSGQLEELSTNERFVFDTWFRHNGELPIIQKTNDWLNISLFNAYKNNFTNPE